MSKAPIQKSLGGILLLAVLMAITVALAVVGTLEERSKPTTTPTQLTNTTSPTGERMTSEVVEKTNMSTTTVKI